MKRLDFESYEFMFNLTLLNGVVSTVILGILCLFKEYRIIQLIMGGLLINVILTIIFMFLIFIGLFYSNYQYKKEEQEERDWQELRQALGIRDDYEMEEYQFFKNLKEINND